MISEASSQHFLDDAQVAWNHVYSAYSCASLHQHLHASLVDDGHGYVSSVGRNDGRSEKVKRENSERAGRAKAGVQVQPGKVAQELHTKLRN